MERGGGSFASLRMTVKSQDNNVKGGRTYEYQGIFQAGSASVFRVFRVWPSGLRLLHDEQDPCGGRSGGHVRQGGDHGLRPLWAGAVAFYHAGRLHALDLRPHEHRAALSRGLRDGAALLHQKPGAAAAACGRVRHVPGTGRHHAVYVHRRALRAGPAVCGDGGVALRGEKEGLLDCRARTACLFVQHLSGLFLHCGKLLRHPHDCPALPYRDVVARGFPRGRQNACHAAGVARALRRHAAGGLKAARLPACSPGASAM